MVLILYILVNVLFIMSIELFGSLEFNIIMGGVILLWEFGFYLVVMVIFIVSIVILVVKLVVFVRLIYVV